MTALVLPLVFACGGVAVWALRTAGARGLWGACGITLLLILLLALTLSVVFRVPSTGRLVLYFFALAGPAIVLPTLVLWRAPAALVTGWTQLAAALMGGLVGLISGHVLVVYRLGIW